MKKKVIVAGHICLDITPVFPEREVHDLSQMLSPGKLIQMGEADVHTGGAVANTGLAMKILGADVSLMGKIGWDAFGDIVYSILKKYQAESGLIRAKQESTSYSVVLAVPGIDRIFLHNSGANHSFSQEDISESDLEEVALLHFGYPPLMRNMYQNEGKELLAILGKAKNAGVATSLDMAAIDGESDAAYADWNLILQRILPYVDFFMPSVEELCFMLDRPRFESWKERAGSRDITEILDIDTDVKPLADMCMSYGARVLLIKCGAPGMYYRTAGENRIQEISSRVGIDATAWANKEGFESSYVPEQILSGTGAGDTSIAAFLTAMLEGCSLEDALHLATATGASCVAAYDALSGLKPLDELRQKIKAGWRKTNASYNE